MLDGKREKFMVVKGSIFSSGKLIVKALSKLNEIITFNHKTFANEKYEFAFPVVCCSKKYLKGSD